MPKLTNKTIQERYKIVNDLYQKFSYEIAVYSTENYSKKATQKLAAELRLALRKFL